MEVDDEYDVVDETDVIPESSNNGVEYKEKIKQFVESSSWLMRIDKSLIKKSITLFYMLRARSSAEMLMLKFLTDS